MLMNHILRIRLDGQVANTMSGNIPLFVPRLGDVIHVNGRRAQLVVTRVEIEYFQDRVEIDVFTKLGSIA